jgi:hypothetical protein|tara:strand:+ start:2100 stop:2597 length:498 start_codon:yes stop_codon:yes gene_type:complete
MGLHEKYKAEIRLRSLLQAFYDMRTFDLEGVFSNKISLNYKATSEQPWIFFDCIDNDMFSFKAHDLHLREDSLSWHLAAQRNKKIKFEGFVNKLYHLDIGSLRGDMTMYGGFRDLGVLIKKGKVINLRRKEEIEDNYGIIFSSLIGYIEYKRSLEEKSSEVKQNI